jgi:hypothetical protein
VLKYGSVKAKFTANAIYRQTLVVQAAQAVKVAGQMVPRHSVVVITLAVANVVANAEMTGNQVVAAIAEAVLEQVVKVVLVVAVTAVRVVQVAAVQVVKVAVTVQVAQERDNYKIERQIS